MEAFRVVVFPPFFDEDLCLAHAVEYLAIQEAVSEARLEAFALYVLPRAARFDIGYLRADRLDPVLHGLSYKFRAVI